jgi:hypothetical protein
MRKPQYHISNSNHNRRQINYNKYQVIYITNKYKNKLNKIK